ncbi:MAG: GNAT family N-acetyltransferase [Eubacteriales bacterium]|nr:GNAT family N-acetyltransferase [Eubacteriales bacterium]MDD3199426.1 GNAT family N-acetyltransferase [Eubacteriales bacterium]MDD4121752.1 GNAT family N-acetyltransferase [Eubacteriales bacterium]
MENKLLKIRKAYKDDLESLKEIWKLCFEDEDSYIDFYFSNRDWTSEMAVLLLDGSIISMLTMIPVDLIEGNGRKIRSSMFYAIATHPQYRKRGLADTLMEWSSRYLLSDDIPVTVLVPAEPGLFDFYDGRGYKTACFIREEVLTRTLIEKFSYSNQQECRLYPAEPDRYNRIRKKLLAGFPYIDYREAEILYQKKASQLFSADIYTIIAGKEEGCAIVERTEEKVFIKEILIPRGYLISAVKEISKLMPAQYYILRTPSFTFAYEGMGGSIRPFGMLKSSGRVTDIHARDIYLGIAFD